MSEGKMCSNCIYADFRYNDAPVGSGRSTFLCTKKSSFKNYADVACKAWENRWEAKK
jgi:hypothetical protein